MKAIRSRETRLGINEVREMFKRSPIVLKVTGRRINEQGMEEMDLTLYTITNFDVEFANNFFYPIHNDSAPLVTLMMVPFNLNGDE